MRINDDLTKPVIVHAAKLDWVKSPAAGVDRRMLYREGDEVARATSFVRYAPGSAFPRHVHSGGEEILMLEGTFQDEHGGYPAGSYFRKALFSKGMHFSSQVLPMAAFRQVRGDGSGRSPARWTHLSSLPRYYRRPGATSR